jgi:folate-binding protein YgfZ
MNIKDISGYSLDENLVCIQISGEDTEKFLQGQFSNDISKVSGKDYQYSSYSTNQGKVISIFRIIRQEKNYLLLVNKKIANYFVEKLSMYILMSKVEINILNDFKVYGLIGKTAENILSNNQIKDNMYLQSTKYFILNNNNKYLPAAIIITKEENIETLESFSNSSKILKFNVNEFVDNLLLLPRITILTKETYIPQVLCLEGLDGINYKKGCYTGQEIVARTHYLGKIKKKLFLLKHTESDVAVRDKIHNGDGEIVGEIFTPLQMIDGIFLCLGVINLDAIQNKIFINQKELTLF